MKNNYIVFHLDDLVLSHDQAQFNWDTDYKKHINFALNSVFCTSMLIIGGYKSFHNNYNMTFNRELYNFCLPHKNKLLLVPVNNTIFDFTRAIKI